MDIHCGSSTHKSPPERPDQLRLFICITESHGEIRLLIANVEVRASTPHHQRLEDIALDTTCLGIHH
jgi:hypothetical protein